MSNEQIEELAKIVAKCDDTSRAASIATALYNAGYRKPLCAIGDKLYIIIEDDSSPTGYTVEINHVTEVGERYIFFSGFVPNGDDLTNRIPISELGRNFFLDEGELRRALEARRSDL